MSCIKMTPTDLIDQINKISSSFRFSYDYDELGYGLYKFQVLFKYGPEFTRETHRLTLEYVLQSAEPGKIYTTSKSGDIRKILEGFSDAELMRAKAEPGDSFCVDDGEIVRFIRPSEMRDFLKDLISSFIDLGELFGVFSPENLDYSLNHFYNTVRKHGISVGGYKILV